MATLEEMELKQEQALLEQEIESEVDEYTAPTFGEKVLASANLNITGFNKFSNMVENKHMMYSNDGDDQFYLSDTFKEMTKGLTAEDTLELRDARNPRYLEQRIANQKRWHRDNEILEQSGAEGIALEVTAGILDPFSWLVGGGIYKGFKTASKALELNGRSLMAMNVIAGGSTAGITAGTSEALIQNTAGIYDEERLKTITQFATALGVGVPALYHTVKGVGGTDTFKSVVDTLDQGTADNSFIRRFAVSTSEQLRTSGTTQAFRDIGDVADTPSRAYKNSDGDFVVSSKDTAMDIKRGLTDANINEIERHIHARAKANGTDNATQAQMDGTEWNNFRNEVEQDVRATMGKMSDDDLRKTYTEATGKTVDEIPEDIYDVVGAHLKSKGFDEGRYIEPKGVAYIGTFYSNFGKKASDIELGGIAGKDSRGYGHIKYNQQEILSDVEGATKKFEEMLRADRLNQKLLERGELTDEDITSTARHLIDVALDSDMARRYLDKGTSGSTSAVRKRRLRMDTSLHPELLLNDIGVIATEYADNIGGKIALKETYGLQADANGSLSNVLEAKYKELAEEARLTGASDRDIKRDLENTKAIYETVLGTRKFSQGGASTVGRLGKKSANALYSAGFVVYGMVEPWVAVARFGLGNTMKNFMPSFGRLKQHMSTVKPTDPIVKLIKHSGLAGMNLRGIRYDRLDSNEIASTQSGFENFLDKASHWSRKYSGFNYVTDISDFIAGGSAMDSLFKIGQKGTASKAEASQLARFGLSLDDAKAIVKQPEIKWDSNGNIMDYSLESWANKDLAKKTERYLRRAVADTIVRADGTRVHRWQSDVKNPFFNMAMQYTQMPTALYERLIYNGMDEASSRTVVGIIGSMVSMYSILSLENEAEKSLGGEGLTEDELLVKTITRIPFAGILPNVYDYSMVAMGEANSGGYIGRDVSQFGGASIGVFNKALRALQGLGDGVQADEEVKNFMKLVPIMNSLVGVKHGFNAINRELSGE